MTRTLQILIILGSLGVLLALTSAYPARSAAPLPEWPDIDSNHRVWTRWWWHGSAVTPEGITGELETLREAGFGGVELTPIFGVIGEEDAFVDYLSDEWMDLLEHTIREADRLGMQIDMATGTGWPFGGPWVGTEDASKYLTYETFELEGGQRLQETIGTVQEPILRRVGNQPLLVYRAAQEQGRAVADVDVEALMEAHRRITIADIDPDLSANADLQALAIDQLRFADPLALVSLMAYGANGETLDLTNRVRTDGALDWTAPTGDWKLYALFTGQHGKMVERAAPGGEGYVIDHFSRPAIDRYLARFDDAFGDRDLNGLRAFFNDSYEVDDASGQSNWTPEFLDTFRVRRGYDLLQHLPALLGENATRESARVLSDFRETYSDLLLSTFTQGWDSWAEGHGALIRNQAHGSPAAILDLYAASDIPETEGTEDLRIKFATSAAHVSGKQLVSAEAATWLGEHFLSTAADLKANLDRYLVNGVNHLVYHGNAYSPPGDAYPGRLFYAAFHANDRNSLWQDLKAVNAYVARSQSLLQRGTPDNDILLYFPIYDRFATPGGELLEHFDGHGPSLEETPVYELGAGLLAAGHSFDFISDRQVRAASFEDGISTGGVTYKTVVVPETTHMPLATLQALLSLAEAGGTVIFENQLPATVPGLVDWELRQEKLRALLGGLDFADEGEVEAAALGNGRIILSDDTHAALEYVAVHREPMVDAGLSFTRRNYGGGKLYFITNFSEAEVRGGLDFAAEGSAAVLLDPMTDRRGLARTQSRGKNQLTVDLQVAPGESIMVWISPDPVTGESWPYFTASGNPVVLDGNWQLEFTTGGDEMPPAAELSGPAPWTEQQADVYQFFSGTGRYTTSFTRPAGAAEAYLLDLGAVFETARVSLNGDSLATLVGPDYRLTIPAHRLQDENILTVEVSNRMVNRIIKLDRDGVFWKKFYNTNFPPRLRENSGPLGVFDAADWDPVPSGLAGPVTLTPGGTTTK